MLIFLLSETFLKRKRGCKESHEYFLQHNHPNFTPGTPQFNIKQPQKDKNKNSDLFQRKKYFLWHTKAVQAVGSFLRTTALP